MLKVDFDWADPPPSRRDRFARAANLLDLPLLQNSKVTIFGLGSGGQHLARTLAGSGVGAFALIDNDIVSMTNIATSMVKMADIGRKKVSVAASAIHAIAPEAKVTIYGCNDSDLPESTFNDLIASSDLVLHLTDDPPAALRLNTAALRHGRDVLHGASHPGTLAYECIGTLADARETGRGCYRCHAKARCDLIEAGGTAAEPESFAATRLSAEMRNATIANIAIGLLHYRAGSTRPIAEIGRNFANWPCWVGRVDGNAFTAPGQLFNKAPPGLMFGAMPYRGTLPQDWQCPACGRTGP